MSFFNKFYKNVSDVPSSVTDDHVGAYAAQTAYFFMLSIVPIILLLLLMIRVTPVTKADVMAAVITVFPSSVDSLITSVVNQVYSQSMTVIPVTVIVALWSAGKGMMALTNGLNCIYKCRETRNYFIVRIRATLYTLVFLLFMISLLILAVFGNTAYHYLQEHAAFMNPVLKIILEYRQTATPILIICIVLMIYKVLPNRRVSFLLQLPGAIFASAGWMIVSFIFSIYLDIFTGFSSMYGSLTTIILIMLWMYFCMYSILLGAELNVFVYDTFKQKHENAKKKRELKKKLKKADKEALPTDEELFEEFEEDILPDEGFLDEDLPVENFKDEDLPVEDYLDEDFPD